MRDPVGPPCCAVYACDALSLEGLDVGNIEHLRRDDRRDILVTYASAFELGAGPIPTERNRLPSLFVTAPPIEAGCLGRMRIEILDCRDVTVRDHGHRRMQSSDSCTYRRFELLSDPPDKSVSPPLPLPAADRWQTSPGILTS